MLTNAERKQRHRESVQRHRAKMKAAGLINPLTEEQKKRQREKMTERRRAAAEAGVKLRCDTWAARNPDKHRKAVAHYRAQNPESAKEHYRTAQARRRSTPWGMINNRIFTVLHHGIRRRSTGTSKYTKSLGYTWADVALHLEAQFTPDMTWENWGDVWELDHIKPLCTFQYVSLDDPLYAEAWALSNLRPLAREENAKKGSKPVAA